MPLKGSPEGTPAERAPAEAFPAEGPLAEGAPVKQSILKVPCLGSAMLLPLTFVLPCIGSVHLSKGDCQ